MHIKLPGTLKAAKTFPKLAPVDKNCVLSMF